MVEGSVMGTGIDLVETSRIRDLVDRWGARFKDRVFTPLEQSYCESKAAPYRHYAGRWAVKEAVSKAFGTGIVDSMAWLDIEVANDARSGAPAVRLSEKGARLAGCLGIGGIHVSLSHTRAYAAAQAILTAAARPEESDPE